MCVVIVVFLLVFFTTSFIVKNNFHAVTHVYIHLKIIYLFFKNKKMKYPSSPLLVYLIIYSSLFVLSIILNSILFPLISSPLHRLYIIDFSVTCILFLIGNFVFLSNNIYDLHWPLIPVIFSIYFHLINNSVNFLSLKHLLLICLICFWSFHLIWQTISSSNNIQHEDWRYQKMRQQYKDYFLIFAFFALHLLPMFVVLIGSSSIYYIYDNTQMNSNLTIIDLSFLSLIFLAILLENLADKQLREFRSYKQKYKQQRFSVLSNGLWKYSRHPNYLGEILFWWFLFFYGYYSNAPLWYITSPLIITFMMIFGSIPMIEERLYRKYPDYKFIQQRISRLIPTFG